MKLLLFGDLHLRKGHLQQGESVSEALVSKTIELQPDIVVLLGDVLHTHEMVYVKALRLLEELVDHLRKLALVYILIGNHDYISASEFQTQEHPLGPFKKWDRVTVIDCITLVELGKKKVVMTPYIPYHKFIQSLESFLGDQDLDPLDLDLVLGHQPFLPVDPKAEAWPSHFPVMISGHIHDRCKPQENLYYVGASCQVNYSESPDKYACFVNLSGKKSWKFVRLKVRSVHLEKVKVADLLPGPLIEITRNHDVRLILQGTREEKTSFEETKNFRTLKAAGIKLSWELEMPKRDPSPKKRKRKDFEIILKEMVAQSDPRVRDAYKLIFGEEISPPE